MWKCFHGCLHYIWSWKKNIQFGILGFHLEAQEINLRGNMWDSKCDEYWIFLWEFFSFYEKDPSPLDHVAFFSKYFYLNLPWYFQLILISQLICSFTKRVQKIAIKRDSSPKHVLEVIKGIEHLQQNASDKLHFSDPESEQA